MKRKKINLVLIFLLIFIWLKVFNKFFYVKKDKATTSYTNYIPNTFFKYKKKDTFYLKKIKDPFYASVKISRKNLTIKKKRKIKRINKSIRLPKIKYLGFIKKKESKYKLVLLRVNDTLFKIKERKQKGNIYVIKAYKDSVIFLYSKNKLVIKKY